ncbi:hypothetical protein BDN70DRAFT_587446 [Pholiota conissans]|uniref:Nephrocystin 3-like N-terminal domain-containing protein n=1 Tax=Pholiota conissans TaxID=109636 RepID=A0A9P5ZDG9_9AGAR|nr:hypothetical protein BDN70DRAFT_587446 [Pholiota conissans]
MTYLEHHVAGSALYNSAPCTSHSFCHPNTCVDPLEELFNWALNYKIQILWLKGPAGSSKSTIIRSIIPRFLNAAIPIATFLFSTDDDTRNNMKQGRLAATLAYQLIQVIPETLPHILTVVCIMFCTRRCQRAA